MSARRKKDAFNIDGAENAILVQPHDPAVYQREDARAIQVIGRFEPGRTRRRRGGRHDCKIPTVKRVDCDAVGPEGIADGAQEPTALHNPLTGKRVPTVGNLLRNTGAGIDDYEIVRARQQPGEIERAVLRHATTPAIRAMRNVRLTNDLNASGDRKRRIVSPVEQAAIEDQSRVTTNSREVQRRARLFGAKFRIGVHHQ
jgi:hypothetical protein